MPGRREIVDIILKATGAEAVGREFDKIGKTAKTAGDHVDTGFKGKMQQAGSFVSAAMPALLATGGAAIAGFAIKGISDFQNLALASGKMADATGLSVEEASRLIEVFGDVGVSGEAVQGAILKMNKAIGTNRAEFEKLGLVGATTNETFGNVITYLNGIKDPADRAREGTRLLGKSWAELAEVIEAGGTNLKQSLEDVGDTKVIDAQELRKARDFRQALENLKENAEQLSIKLGQALVPALAQVAKWADKVAHIDLPSWLSDAKDAVVSLGNLPWDIVADGIESISTTWEDLTDGETDAQEATRKTAEIQEKLGQSTKNLVGGLIELKGGSEDAADAEAKLTEETEKANEASQAQYDAFRRQRDAAEGLMGAARDLADVNWDLFQKQTQWNSETKSRTLPNAIELADLTRKQAEAQAKASGQTMTAAQGLDVWNRKMIDSARTADGPLKQAIVNYITTANNIPAEKVTELSAAIDAGDYARARAILAQGVAVAMRPYVDQSDLARARAAIGATVRGRVGMFAEGTDSAPGGLAIVGEQGPELVNLPRGSQVVPNHELRGGAGLGAITIQNMTVVANDPEQFVRQLETYARRNGRGRLQKIVNG